MPFCTKCGGAVATDHIFCATCGRQVDAETQNSGRLVKISVGGYALDTQIRMVGTEADPSPDTDYRKKFDREKGYWVEVQFLGREWLLTLGTVNGQIYTISAHVESTNEEDTRSTKSAAVIELWFKVLSSEALVTPTARLQYR